METLDPFVLNIILLSPLILGMLISQLVPWSLKRLQALYVLLAAVNVLLSYFLVDQWLLPAVFAVGGFVVLVVLTGILGQKVRPQDYVFMEVGIGLFPWAYWGFTAGFIYGIILVLFGVLIALRPKFKNPFQKRRY